MFGSIGLPELLIVILWFVFWIAPIVAAIWALLTLQKIRTGQDDVRVKLASIERLLQRQ